MTILLKIVYAGILLVTTDWSLLYLLLGGLGDLPLPPWLGGGE